MYKKYKVYLLTFPNGKHYCGFTGRDLQKRFNGAGYGYKKCPLVWKAIQKYGWENIKKDVIFDSENKNAALNKERQTIKEMHLQNPNFGYNIDQGGTPTGTASHLTETGRKALSEKTKARWANPEYRKKISEKAKLHPPTKECIKKGVIASAEKRRGQPAKNRQPVYQIDLNTEKIIADFPSASHASISLIGDTSGCTNILKVCKGKRKTAYGYGWRLITNE